MKSPLQSKNTATIHLAINKEYGGGMQILVFRILLENVTTKMPNIIYNRVWIGHAENELSKKVVIGVM